VLLVLQLQAMLLVLQNHLLYVGAYPPAGALEEVAHAY
jgi:hypothetical protein